MCHNALKFELGQHTTTGTDMAIYIKKTCLSVVVYLISSLLKLLLQENNLKSLEKQSKDCEMSTATLRVSIKQLQLSFEESQAQPSF